MKKKIIGLIIIIVLIGVSLFSYYYTREFLTGLNGACIVELNQRDKLILDKNYKNLFLDIKIDNSEEDDDVILNIINPNGKVENTLIVKGKETKEFNEKYKGRKGQWIFEFIKDDLDENTSFEIEARGNNK